MVSPTITLTPARPRSPSASTAAFATLLGIARRPKPVTDNMLIAPEAAVAGRRAERPRGHAPAFDRCLISPVTMYARSHLRYPAREWTRRARRSRASWMVERARGIEPPS